MIVTGYFDSETKGSKRSHMRSWHSQEAALEEFECYAEECIMHGIIHPFAMLNFDNSDVHVLYDEISRNTPDFMFTYEDNKSIITTI